MTVSSKFMLACAAGFLAATPVLATDDLRDRGSPLPSGMTDHQRSVLANTEWELRHYRNDFITAHDIPDHLLANYRVRFDEDGMASYQLDCNRGSSQWLPRPGRTENSGELFLSQISSTRMACGRDRHYQLRFPSNLRFSYSTRSLSIENGNGSYQSVWRRVPGDRYRIADLPPATVVIPGGGQSSDGMTTNDNSVLANTEWYFDSFTRASRWIPIPNGAQPSYTIRFDRNGIIRMQLFCNSGAGAWRIDSNASDRRGDLQMGPFRRTMTDCQSRDYGAQIVRDLGEVEFFRMASGNLYLRLANGQGSYRLRPVENADSADAGVLRIPSDVIERPRRRGEGRRRPPRRVVTPNRICEHTARGRVCRIVRDHRD